MSEKIFEKLKYIHNPKSQKFHVLISCEFSHLFEKEKRSGYTQKIEEAGVFSSTEANNATKHIEASGYLRWAIPIQLVEHIQTIESQNKKLVEALKKYAKTENWKIDTSSGNRMRVISNDGERGLLQGFENVKTGGLTARQTLKELGVDV